MNVSGVSLGPSPRSAPHLDDVIRYLLAAGWTQVDTDQRSSLWHPRDDLERPDVRVVLPLRENVADYAATMVDALRAVAYVERRLTREVIDEVGFGGADNVSVRLTPDAPSGEAPLRLAQAAVNALRSYVVGSASSIAMPPQLVLPARRPHRAEWYGDHARIGMRAGSFVLTLSLPLDEHGGSTESSASEIVGQTALDAPSQPFGRRVTERMKHAVRTAQWLADRVAEGAEAMAAFGRQPSIPVNATELAALGEIGGPDFKAYDIRFAPSPTIPSGDSASGVFTVTPGQQRIFTEASEYLRSKQPRAGVLVTGLVVRLFRPSAFGPGEIVIDGFNDDSERRRRFKVELSEGEYSQAVVAHTSGLQVQARGDLVIRGTRLTLRNVTLFSAIPGLDEDGS